MFAFAPVGHVLDSFLTFSYIFRPVPWLRFNDDLNGGKCFLDERNLCFPKSCWHITIRDMTRKQNGFQNFKPKDEDYKAL